MSDVGSFFAGLAITAAGVALTIATAGTLSNVGLMIAAQGVGLMAKGIMSPSRPDPEGMQDNLGSQKATLPVVYGRAKVGCKIVDTWVNPSSSDREQLIRVAAICLGSQDGTGIQDIEKVWLDNTLAIDPVTPGDTGTADWQTSGRDSFFVPHMEYVAFKGTDAQPVPSPMNNLNATRWPSSWELRRVAYVALNLTKEKEVFPRIPNITVQVKGQKVYDPRDSTWKYSTNPALCLLDYLTSPGYGADLFYPERDGGNTALGEIDEQSFIDEANFADELVQDGDGGTQKRFEVNGWLDTGNGLRENIDALLSAMRGELIHQNGKFRLVIRKAGSSVMTLDETVIKGGWQLSRAGAKKVPTRVAVQHPAGTFGDRSGEVLWPEEGDDTFVDQDGGHRNTRQMQLPLTQDRIMAQQIGMVTLKEAREDATIRVVCHESVANLEAGDIFTIDHPTPGWDGASAKDFVLYAMRYVEDHSIEIVGREYAASAYSLDPQTRPTPPPGSNLPDSTTTGPITNLQTFSGSNTQISLADGSKVPGILATWDLPVDKGIDRIRVLHRKQGASNWEVGPSVEPNDAQRALFPVPGATEGDTWEVGVYVVVGQRQLRSTMVTDTVTIDTDFSVADLIFSIMEEDLQESDFDGDGVIEGRLIVTVRPGITGTYDVDFETRQGRGTSWTAGTSSTGLTSGNSAQDEVELMEGQLGFIRYTVKDNATGDILGRIVVQFDRGSVPNVSINSINFTSDGSPEISLAGDSDTDAGYVKGKVGSNPASPQKTNLAAAANAGDSVVKVNDATIFTAGEGIQVGQPGDIEDHVVDSINTGVSPHEVTLVGTLATAKANGDLAVDAHAHVDARSGTTEITDFDLQVNETLHVDAVGTDGNTLGPVVEGRQVRTGPPPVVEYVRKVGHTNNTCPFGDDLILEWHIENFSASAYDLELQLWGDWDKDGAYAEKESAAASSDRATADQGAGTEETYNIGYIQDGVCVAVNYIVKLVVKNADTGSVEAVGETAILTETWYRCLGGVCAVDTGDE